MDVYCDISNIIDDVQLPFGPTKGLYFSRYVTIDLPLDEKSEIDIHKIDPSILDYISKLQAKYKIIRSDGSTTFGTLNDNPSIVMKTSTGDVKVMPSSARKEFPLQELTKSDLNDKTKNKMKSLLRFICGDFVQDDDIIFEEYEREDEELCYVATLNPSLKPDLDGFFNELSNHLRFTVSDEFTEYVKLNNLDFIAIIKEFDFLQELRKNDSSSSNYANDIVDFIEKKNKILDL